MIAAHGVLPRSRGRTYIGVRAVAQFDACQRSTRVSALEARAGAGGAAGCATNRRALNAYSDGPGVHVQALAGRWRGHGCAYWLRPGVESSSVVNGGR